MSAPIGHGRLNECILFGGIAETLFLLKEAPFLGTSGSAFCHAKLNILILCYEIHEPLAIWTGNCLI